MIENLNKEIRALDVRLKKTKNLLYRERNKNKNVEINVKKFLNHDQIHFLKTKSGTLRFHKWSTETIEKSLKIRLNKFVYICNE